MKSEIEMKVNIKDVEKHIKQLEEQCEDLKLMKGLNDKIEELEKENAELKEENRQLKNEVEDLRAYCNQIGKIKTDVLKIFEHIVAR